MQALEKLSRSEESVILEMVRINRLDASQIACHMTRQRDSGRGRHPDGRGFNISYDLLLCQFCGNLMPSACCPKKVADLKERLRHLNA